MAIPAVAAMHDRGYAVDWVAGEAVATILRLYPWIHVMPVDEAGLLQGGATERLRAMRALWNKLLKRAGGRPYDYCATLYYDRRYRLLTLPVRANARLQLSWSDRSRRLLPGRHHTDEYTRILTGRTDGETPVHVAPLLAPRLPPNPRPRNSQRVRIVLVPAGARNLLRDDALRRWPVQNYVALAQSLLAGGHEVLLIGGGEDTWAASAFSGLAGAYGTDQFADLIGGLNLPETLALLDSADVTVSHDTGPLHLAGITRTALIGVFGPTDPHGRLPQRGNCMAIWGGESFGCRPCYDGHDYAPCAHNGCIREVTPAMVLRATNILLEARRSGCELPPRVLSTTELMTSSLTAIAPLAERSTA